MPSVRDVGGGGALLVAVASSLLAYGRLPAEMAIHWNATGVADSTVSKPVALAIFPAAIALVWAIFAVDHRVDPLGSNIRAFGQYHDAFAAGLMGFLAYCHGLVIVWNLGYELDVLVALAPPLAGLYYAMGAVLEEAEQNWFVGIRTPWTLSSEAVWNRTHERFGPLYKLSAPLALLAVVVPVEFAVYALVGPVLLVSLAAVAYSFVLYRRIDGGEGGEDGDAERGLEA